MNQDNPRQRRVGEQIKRELATLIRDQLNDPKLGMVTVSAVHISRDLSYAKVYVTVLGDQAKLTDSLRVLKRAAGFLRHALGRRMILRMVPELRFVYDESIERGRHLTGLIEEAVATDAHNAHRDNS